MSGVEATGGSGQGVREKVEVIVEILEEHCGSYEDLNGLLEAQEEFLQENDLDGLRRVLAAQDEILARVATSEQRRHSAHLHLVEMSGGRHRDLRDIIAHFDLPGEMASRAGRAEARLRDLTSDIRQLNESNGRLVEQALHYVNYSLEAIRELALDAGTYRDGDRGNGPPSMLMDKRV